MRPTGKEPRLPANARGLEKVRVPTIGLGAGPQGSSFIGKKALSQALPLEIRCDNLLKSRNMITILS